MPSPVRRTIVQHHALLDHVPKKDGLACHRVIQMSARKVLDRALASDSLVQFTHTTRRPHDRLIRFSVNGGLEKTFMGSISMHDPAY